MVAIELRIEKSVLLNSGALCTTLESVVGKLAPEQNS